MPFYNQNYLVCVLVSKLKLFKCIWNSVFNPVKHQSFYVYFTSSLMTSLGSQWPYKYLLKILIVRISHFTYILLKHGLHRAKTTFADSLNTFQSDKERGMTDHKVLVPQLTERKLSVMAKTCHCSVPISPLLTSSTFNCISPWEVPFPCLYTLAESLSSSLHYFLSWSCWHLLRSAPSCRLTKCWERELLNVRVSHCVQFLRFQKH